MVTITGLDEADREAWEGLFRGYLRFYRQDLAQDVLDRLWDDLLSAARVHALGARLDGRLVGITHFLAHPSTWGADVCYLEDLFTDPEARGRGVGRSLIDGVVAWAREQGCGAVYWQTHQANSTARRLYDEVGTFEGFIVYRIALDGADRTGAAQKL
ncbi:MAG TPA: GNAT family N-acetyltransferase [Intrasporangium sp.]|nr:GNAT family N-acetyltransferase [Intrasporangium sp.]